MQLRSLVTWNQKKSWISVLRKFPVLEKKLNRVVPSVKATYTYKKVIREFFSSERKCVSLDVGYRVSPKYSCPKRGIEAQCKSCHWSFAYVIFRSCMLLLLLFTVPCKGINFTTNCLSYKKTESSPDQIEHDQRLNPPGCNYSIGYFSYV